MNMKSATVSLIVFLVLAVGFSSTVRAEELSKRELRKIVRQADKEREAGRYEQAVELYQQILDGAPADHERREQALWVVAMHRLSSNLDDATALQYLDELTESFPNHAYRLELAVATAAFEALGAARAEIDGAKSEIEAREAALAAERQSAEEAQEKSAGESAEADDRISSLESQLRRVRSELATTKEELEKKEEALQRLLKLRSGSGSG